MTSRERGNAALRLECERYRARIAELEADLIKAEKMRVAWKRSSYLENQRAEKAEARLAAVIAKFDGHHMFRGQCIGCVRRFGGVHYECGLADVRAAATGDTK